MLYVLYLLYKLFSILSALVNGSISASSSSSMRVFFSTSDMYLTLRGLSLSSISTSGITTYTSNVDLSLFFIVIMILRGGRLAPLSTIYRDGQNNR